MLRADGKDVRLTNLRKIFWPALRLTKGDLLQYYADVANVLLPHLRDRAMVMKRYPNGAEGPFFFMKRAPSPRPAWIETCRIDHGHGNVIDFPMIQDLASQRPYHWFRSMQPRLITQSSAARSWITGKSMTLPDP